MRHPFQCLWKKNCPALVHFLCIGSQLHEKKRSTLSWLTMILGPYFCLYMINAFSPPYICNCQSHQWRSIWRGPESALWPAYPQCTYESKGKGGKSIRKSQWKMLCSIILFIFAQALWWATSTMNVVWATYIVTDGQGWETCRASGQLTKQHSLRKRRGKC